MVNLNFMEAKMNKAAYSIREVAEMGIGSPSHIRRMVLKGEIPAIKLGARYVIPAFWIKQNFQKSSAENE